LWRSWQVSIPPFPTSSACCAPHPAMFVLGVTMLRLAIEPTARPGPHWPDRRGGQTHAGAALEAPQPATCRQLKARMQSSPPLAGHQIQRLVVSQSNMWEIRPDPPASQTTSPGDPAPFSCGPLSHQVPSLANCRAKEFVARLLAAARMRSRRPVLPQALCAVLINLKAPRSHPLTAATDACSIWPQSRHCGLPSRSRSRGQVAAEAAFPPVAPWPAHSAASS